MFGIEWLRGGSSIERETSVLTNQDDAIAAAVRRAPEVARRHPGREPDSFRLNDALGKEIDVFPIDGQSMPPRS